MKFSFVPQTFSIFFFCDQDEDQDFTIKFIGESYSLYAKDIHQISHQKFCSGSASGSRSWYYFGFQYQTYISYIEDTYQILFGSVNSFESYCVHMKSPRTYSQTTRQTNGNFFCLFCLLRHTKHEHSSKGENCFFTHALTILSLYTYSVCDEKVKSTSIFATYSFTMHLTPT